MKYGQQLERESAPEWSLRMLLLTGSGHGENAMAEALQCSKR